MNTDLRLGGLLLAPDRIPEPCLIAPLSNDVRCTTAWSVKSKRHYMRKTQDNWKETELQAVGIESCRKPSVCV